MSYQESFISYLKYERRYSPHTINAYKNDLDQFVQFCTEMVGEFNVKRVDSKQVRNWVVVLMEQQLSARSVNRKVTTIKAFFKFLMKGHVVESNPAVNIPLPKIRKKLPNFIDENSLNHLLDDGFFENNFKGTRDKLIISLLYGTGIRLAELISLKDADIDTENYSIRVLGKRKKERIVPYPRSINNLLFQYFDIRNREIHFQPGYLLVTEKGKQVYEKLIYHLMPVQKL